MHFLLKPQYAASIYWSRRGSCSLSGCVERDCVCSFCGLPIGVDEEDPRWDDHPEYCQGCELCRDQVPICLFRREGKVTEQARFHSECFEKIAFLQVGMPEPVQGDSTL